jgi:hypothetical protein
MRRYGMRSTRWRRSAFGGDPVRLGRRLIEHVDIDRSTVSRWSDRTCLSGQSSPGGHPFGAGQDLGGHPERGVEHETAWLCPVHRGETFGEAGDVLYLGSPEPVDRLARVAGHGEIATCTGDGIEEVGLGG